MKTGLTGAVIVAAGSGTRLPGPAPKPLLRLGSTTILERTLQPFEQCHSVDRIVVVVGADHVASLSDRLAGKVAAVVGGAPDRRGSVAAGLDALPQAQWLVIHDGVRPFVTPALIERVLEAAMRWGAATAGIPVVDTLKEVDQNLVLRTLDRAGLFAVQTPQAFAAGLLREAHLRVPQTAPATDDAGLVEALGAPVAVVTGDPANFKITTGADLELARLRVAERSGPGLRVGTGCDLHRLAPDRALVLGGVRIPHARGLAGHSDADVLTHAVMDALLGAAGESDIGHHFPPADPALRGADSIGLAASVSGMLRAAGWTIVNVDAVVLAEAPMLAPHIEAMRARLAGALGIGADQIGIKATTAEGMGPVGRGEGIEARAVALLRKAE
ncbi:MAG: 2-C-methyl-D-erythritol 2,4-cyclodiphosphate synthase [Armatimonadetes bacterium]|nr:2-C-methyl-D-erythritol 2,4-cyclodiphosphate synthase [Armatimonadota bacterium]